MSIFKSYYSSPIGTIEIISTEHGISSVLFVKEEAESNSNNHTEECIAQLKEYFEGERKEFSLTLDMQGSEFQKKIWSELQSIVFGKTASYIDIAMKLNTPSASRAIGNANSKNEILIVLPCHRVIGKSGDLVGYAGELWRKQWLLDHEARLCGKATQLSLY